MTIEQEIKLQASYAYDDGAHDKAVETARILLANNIDFSIIMESTGLSAEEIKELSSTN